jgi:hypothetical protein
MLASMVQRAKCSHQENDQTTPFSIANGGVKRKTVFSVAYHHWPEQLIIKNKNEGGAAYHH